MGQISHAECHFRSSLSHSFLTQEVESSKRWRAYPRNLSDKAVFDSSWGISSIMCRIIAFELCLHRNFSSILFPGCFFWEYDAYTILVWCCLLWLNHKTTRVPALKKVPNWPPGQRSRSVSRSVAEALEVFLRKCISLNVLCLWNIFSFGDKRLFVISLITLVFISRGGMIGYHYFVWEAHLVLPSHEFLPSDLKCQAGWVCARGGFNIHEVGLLVWCYIAQCLLIIVILCYSSKLCMHCLLFWFW